MGDGSKAERNPQRWWMAAALKRENQAEQGEFAVKENKKAQRTGESLRNSKYIYSQPL